MSTTPFTMYRCDGCPIEQMVSNQDALQFKLEKWLTVTVEMKGGGGHTKHYCPACSTGWLAHHTANPGEAWLKATTNRAEVGERFSG